MKLLLRNKFAMLDYKLKPKTILQGHLGELKYKRIKLEEKKSLSNFMIIRNFN